MEVLVLLMLVLIQWKVYFIMAQMSSSFLGIPHFILCANLLLLIPLFDQVRVRCCHSRCQLGTNRVPPSHLSYFSLSLGVFGGEIFMYYVVSVSCFSSETIITFWKLSRDSLHFPIILSGISPFPFSSKIFYVIKNFSRFLMHMSFL